MAASRIRTVALAAAATLGLSACATDYYGLGGGVGYGRGYYDPYYGGYGRGYGYPAYGWYNDYYYPGRGYWVYSRKGHKHRWNDDQRRHWTHRQRMVRMQSGAVANPRVVRQRSVKQGGGDKGRWQHRRRGN